MIRVCEASSSVAHPAGLAIRADETARATADLSGLTMAGSMICGPPLENTENGWGNSNSLWSTGRPRAAETYRAARPQQISRSVWVLTRIGSLGSNLQVFGLSSAAESDGPGVLDGLRRP